MDVLEAVVRMLSASSLPRANICIDASLFRSVGARTNIGLINAESLSIQIHVNHLKPHGPSGDEPKIESRPASRAGTEHAAANRETPPDPGRGGPRVVDKHLFDVRNTFRFNPDFVFEERKITINTIPIYFVRRGKRIFCEIAVGNTTFSEAFTVRDGEPSILEGMFSGCERPAPDALGLKTYDQRLARLTSHERGHFYRNSRGLLICVFPTAPRKMLPLGGDDGVFSATGFGPAALICVASPGSRGTGASYRIRSHFYVVTDNDDQSRVETAR